MFNMFFVSDDSDLEVLEDVDKGHSGSWDGLPVGCHFVMVFKLPTNFFLVLTIQVKQHRLRVPLNFEGMVPVRA